MSTIETAPVRVREDLLRLAHRGADVREFAFGAGRIPAGAVPFEWMCVLPMDPATLVPTGAVVDDGVPTAAYPRLKELEFGGEDFNAFRSLALSDCHYPIPAATPARPTSPRRRRAPRAARHRSRSGP